MSPDGLAAFTTPARCATCDRRTDGVELVDVAHDGATGRMELCEFCRGVWVPEGEEA
jgi:hypothetical protein